MGTGTLLLNGDYSPLRVVSLKRGINLVLAGKAEILEESDDEVLRSARMAVAAPSVIRLRYFVKVPYRARLPLTKDNLLARDKGRCGYCSRGVKGKDATIDHVIPRSKGGQHEWENVVACCSPCNQKKGDKLLSELRWELQVTPKAPHGLRWYVMGVEIEPSWEPYLAAA